MTALGVWSEHGSNDKTGSTLRTGRLSTGGGREGEGEGEGEGEMSWRHTDGRTDRHIDRYTYSRCQREKDVKRGGGRKGEREREGETEMYRTAETDPKRQTDCFTRR